MKLILPLVLGVSGLAGGLLAGQVLRPPAPEDAAAVEAAAEAPAGANEFLPIDRQFVVPIVQDDRVGALMIVQLSLEIERGAADEIASREPKLRDRFLSVMFRHAESGAFSGAFTAGPAMRDLRGSLLEVAQEVMGPAVRSVLVTDILRQDL